ncbi:hypothetical protein C2U72_13180 [Prosthecomicrobium hirschii]|uniref:leucine-rich repeat domain-containing protein n=1 Tax=Prosthecodimorpha hirschii TaxID=665126 RepID=UPI00112D1E18|nr:leucine-rich repeat domain-containing protein [Prosthecomicrobium hirschii]TPQ50525.1 hypothetical protein C2U72_13180 [Prosthecomicrobium hirschii]
MTQVFVSYAHQDAKAAEQLRTRLADTILHFGLTLWWDAKIQAGQRWNPTIRQAIAGSDIFVQLVSAASLASTYITETEAPAIEQAERGRGALVLTVILEKCSWQRRFGARQAMPSDANRDLLPVRDWHPQRNGWHAVILQSEAAIATWLRQPPDPRFNPAPGPTFGLTPDGFAPVDDPPAAAERIDPQQANLHGQVKRAAGRLDRRISGLQNTHPSVFDEYQDLKTFLGDTVAGTDVAGLWVAKFGLESLHARFSATRAAGTMTEPIEPELLAGIDKLIGVVEIYGLGFQEWRGLSARNRERAREIVDPVAEAVVTRATLDKLADKKAPFAPSARPILAAASRPLPSPDDPNPAASTPAAEVVAAAAGVGANAIGALARAVVSALREVGTVGGGVWVLSTIAGDANLEWVSQAAIFLQAHCAPIADFAARHQDIRRLIGGTIDLLTRKPVPEARTVLPDASAADGSEDTEEGGEFDYEAEAKKLILAGVAPPSAWVPHIRSLDLSRIGVTDLSPLSGLTALKMLDLAGTGVTDLSPLSDLTALETLFLNNTGVTDLSSLSGLTALETLFLAKTGVTDVSSLSGLTALVMLNLSNTGVMDVSPLSTLSGLRWLNLDYTDVTDLSPLSRLTTLKTLYLNNTGVTDVSPLSGLRAVKALDLSNNGLMDVSPLSGLTLMERLNLAGTKVVDVSPLAHLPVLEILRLAGLDLRQSAASLPASVKELDLRGTSWPPGRPLPDVPWRIDPEGTVHRSKGVASPWFESWADEADAFRESRAHPPT